MSLEVRRRWRESTRRSLRLPRMARLPKSWRNTSNKPIDSFDLKPRLTCGFWPSKALRGDHEQFPPCARLKRARWLDACPALAPVGAARFRKKINDLGAGRIRFRFVLMTNG